MTLKRITPPAFQPVTLADLRLQIRADAGITEEDGMLTMLIEVAAQECEHRLGRAIMPATWERVLDDFPQVELELGLPQVQSITSVTYLDTAGAAQTLSPATYYLDADSDGGRGWVLPAAGYTWPETAEAANAVRARFVSGYAAASASESAQRAAVPASVRQWILLRAATLYKYREEVAAGFSVVVAVPGFADRLLDAEKVWSA